MCVFPVAGGEFTWVFNYFTKFSLRLSDISDCKYLPMTLQSWDSLTTQWDMYVLLFASNIETASNTAALKRTSYIHNGICMYSTIICIYYLHCNPAMGLTPYTMGYVWVIVCIHYWPCNPEIQSLYNEICMGYWWGVVTTSGTFTVLSLGECQVFLQLPWTLASWGRVGINELFLPYPRTTLNWFW